MEALAVTAYFTAFALIAGGAFAMMWANIKSINETPIRKKHPEAPEAGEQVMYVDLEDKKLDHRKKWLEEMYSK